ncbi:MAG: hypothetical protein FJW23_16305 [Acidimicrobiia bacterium]|nr:hypothetical protein [Acidimicrobiia bacterium]
MSRACSRVATFRFLCAAMLLLPASAGPAAQSSRDYPQWLGPARDGSAVAFVPPARWPERLSLAWRVDVGLGYATPLLVGTRVFTFARAGGDEVVRAHDVADGRTLWETRYAAPFTENAGTRTHGPGPKSTPLFHDGRLFTLGIGGVVSAFDAADGRLLWQKPAPEKQPLYGTAMSAVAEGDLVVFHVGGEDAGALTAFDTRTGEVRWAWTGDGPSYGSPVIATFGQVRQVVAVTQRFVVGVELSSGRLLWQRPLDVVAFTNSLTPVVLADRVIVSGHGAPTTAFVPLHQGGQWTTETLWETNEVAMKLSNPVVIGDTLFGLSIKARGQYFALDVRTGTVLWKSEPRSLAPGEKPGVVRATENGGTAFIKAGEFVLFLNDAGVLTVAKGTTSGLEPIRTYTLSDTSTWAQPAIVGTRILVKDDSTLALWTLG